MYICIYIYIIYTYIYTYIYIYIPIPQVFCTPSQRVSKAHNKKLAKSRLQFLSRSFSLQQCYCRKRKQMIRGDKHKRKIALVHRGRTRAYGTKRAKPFLFPPKPFLFPPKLL